MLMGEGENFSVGKLPPNRREDFPGPPFIFRPLPANGQFSPSWEDCNAAELRYLSFLHSNAAFPQTYTSSNAIYSTQELIGKPFSKGVFTKQRA